MHTGMYFYCCHWGKCLPLGPGKGVVPHSVTEYLDLDSDLCEAARWILGGLQLIVMPSNV